ncbi:MAG: helix-turn-helix domain-containing protein [Lentisphaerae bacterium]|nr:helix-turn-helix domain-containing protein [Lentisphaerota bacterium]MBT4816467.1 helix-turn-helix domain-containing protein [Lentisphaerota bacterium]MBT5605318.1 helix-turn-helix domain-containing protein [Lentisphaerota bacterium]MBT7055892.1 helix-turn-helix domain-containing protein [Lentisphaerota bacterium]MBT7840948.1 helix-turn-helix domain-containing protein [Lentisphaerota bacterium]
MIQSLQRAFTILELLDREGLGEEGMGAQELANRVGLKFPTAHSFLKSLVELGYLERVPESGKYRTSAQLGRLGNTGACVKALEAVGEREIQRLAEEFRESVSLSLEADFWRESLLIAESDQELRVVHRRRDDQFYRFPVGRVHLSRMSAERLDVYVARNGLPEGDWDGVETRGEVEHALAKIRSEGHAVKRNPAVGAAAISVPILGLPGDLNAALCLVLPLIRFNTARCREIVAALQVSAAAISTKVRDS